MAGAIYRANPQLWQMLIRIGISLGVTMYLTKWLVKLMEPMIDPNYKQKKEAERMRKSLLLRLGRDDIDTSDYEDQIAKEAVNPAEIDCTFDDIGGLDFEKKRLRELVILPFARPELFSRGKLLRPPKGVLLYGPPGTGKTMLAKAIAKETKAVFLNISLSTLQDKWFGESQKLVRAVFTLARKLQPAIIFIDEIDAFLRERSDSEYEGTINMKSEFMSLWDGMSTDQVAQVLVCCAACRVHARTRACTRTCTRPRARAHAHSHALLPCLLCLAGHRGWGVEQTLGNRQGNSATHAPAVFDRHPRLRPAQRHPPHGAARRDRGRARL